MYATLSCLLEYISDLSKFQATTRTPAQKLWLRDKYEIYKEHHDNKTLPQFFPSFYEEYFANWPPTPTMQIIEAARGNVAVATVVARKVEQNVCD